MTSFDITWRDGAYYVSVPNYRGGKVYTSECVEAMAKALGDLLDANERLNGLSYYHQGRDAAIAGQEVAERAARDLLTALLISVPRHT